MQPAVDKMYRKLYSHDKEKLLDRVSKEKEAVNMKLADKLFEPRKEKAGHHKEPAEQINVSRQSISKWESGQALPELEKIVKPSKVFQVTFKTLSAF